jgi:ABC-type polysaccharide/polyol phosphate export permease
VLRLLRSLHANRRLLREFVVRDLKARYVGSSMGFFWSVIFPILNLGVFMFVFRLVLKARWSDHDTPTQTALLMLTGILVWASFAETLSRSTNCLVENANLIQKVVFPSEILTPYLVISSLINMAIGLPIVLLGVIFMHEERILALSFHPERLTASLIILPLLMGMQALFTIGLGNLLATINVFLRDTYHVVGALTTIWMFATPIFYPSRMLDQELFRAESPPEKWGQMPYDFGWLLDINPMHWLIDSYRHVLNWGSWPDPLMIGKFAVVAIAVFWLGSRSFLSQKRSFPDLL